MVITRQVAIPVLSNVTVVMVTSRVRGLRTEVPLGPAHGLDRDCVANCDNVLTVPKRALVGYRGSLGTSELMRLNEALTVALGLDD